MISVCYGEYKEPRSGKRTVSLELTNQGNEPIVLNKMDWVYFYDKPIDATEEFRTNVGEAFEKSSGRTIFKAEETGRRYGFGPIEGEKEGPIASKDCRTYYYPADWLPEMLSIAQSMSAERYWIEITLNGNQIEKLSGRSFGGFLEQQFIEDD